jgi:predicted nucleotidyltransferase
MINFDAYERSILYVKHGSHAYGLNVPTSDEDFKGVCIPPKDSYYGMLNKFEQIENMDSKSEGHDSVIYSLNKFVTLASDCNPNIIEILFVDDSDVIKIDKFGEELKSFRENFISKKIKFTFAGYAAAQLARIETHRKWLLDPPKEAPKRSDFRLSDTDLVSKSELGAYDSLAEKNPDIVLPKNIVTLFTKEKQYYSALTKWKQYQNWKLERNPQRAVMEAKFGLDTKHAMHLIRLMRMCKEVLTSGKVNVKREDKEELLDIRLGRRSYDSLIEETKKLNETVEQLYKTSSLRTEPDKQSINKFLINLTDKYLIERT